MIQMKIKVLAGSFAIVFAMALAPAAFAQSNGNFSATATGASCIIGDKGSLSGGTSATFFDSQISTSSGSGVTLDIRPSLVTGLFTDTKISTTLPSASAEVGIQVCVTVDGSGAGILPATGTAASPASCVIYDERFQEISSQLFSQLTACTAAPTTTVCTTSADCTSLGTGFTCSVPAGATTGVCVGPNPLCNFELILSTLSAHSFDFVVPVDNKKPHEVKATWAPIGTNNGGTSAWCVGPGILTVTEMKVFNNSGALLSF